MPIENALITPAYAAICALVYVALSVRTLLLRRQGGVAIGDGNQPVLSRAIRAHANFSEYVPLALVLMFFLEVSGAAGGWMHVLGVLLVLGRVSHAFGVSQVEENYIYRVSGMALTFTVIISAAARILVQYLS